MVSTVYRRLGPTNFHPLTEPPADGDRFKLRTQKRKATHWWGKTSAGREFISGVIRLEQHMKVFCDREVVAIHLYSLVCQCDCNMSCIWLLCWAIKVGLTHLIGSHLIVLTRRCYSMFWDHSEIRLIKNHAQLTSLKCFHHADCDVR